MPKLKRMSAHELVLILESFGFFIESQRGSHLKLVRILKTGPVQTLIVPNHKSLGIGITKAVFRQVCQYIDRLQLRKKFYS